MFNSTGSWDDAAVYGIPGKYGAIKTYTDNLHEEEKKDMVEREQYEKGFIYLPGLKTTYQEARKYTEEIVKILG